MMSILHEESRRSLSRIRKAAKGKRVVFVSGNFNIVHPGHLRLLRFARECGDYLVVGVLDGTSLGVYLDEQLRLEGIQAIQWVDFAFVLHDPPVEFIRHLRPAVVVKGKEHEEEANPEKEVLGQFGGKLLFSSGEISFSSLDLIQTEWKFLSPSVIKKTSDYPKRHNFTLGELSSVVDDMRKLKVCVIGDTIIDEYITCDALGMSQEEPSIVVAPAASEKYVGGAGIVALHARGLGAQVDYFSVTGKDDTSDYALEKLESRGVKVHFYCDESRPTTLKQRFRVKQKTLLRVSHLRQHAIDVDIRKRMTESLLRALKGFHLLIFADYNYGCLPQSLVDDISDMCRKKGIMMVADSQSSSQIGDVSRFKDMTLLTPTEREARFAVHDFESGLVVLADKLKQKARSKNVIVTLDEEGILVHADIDDKNTWLTDKLPAFNTMPKDVSGAGDSFLTCTSLAMAVGADIWKSAYLGSLAAAFQVGRVGNLPIESQELKTGLVL